MVKKFTKIGLIGRQGVNNVDDTLTTALNCLQQNRCEVLVEQETAQLLRNGNFDVYHRKALMERVDLLIVVGGDGSLINVARSAVEYNVPVLGINRGRMGFLTDIRPQDLDSKITTVLDGCYQEEERFLLNASITAPKTKETVTEIALNEVVLMLGDIPRMIEFSITIDNQFVCAQRADGLIIATPTGSTAYALSGGGPILYPQLDAIVLVPMFPHTLSARSIVVSANSCIVIDIEAGSFAPPWLSCDGQTRLSVSIDAKISIQKHSKALRLIHPLDYNYFETLRTKLHWNKHSHIK